MKKVVTLHSTIRRQKDVLAQALDDDLVMADLESGHYYGLAKTGKRIWELLAQPVVVSDVCAILLREHDVGVSTCEQEVLDFVNELHEEGLVRICAV